jgi:hypothetical protein
MKRNWLAGWALLLCFLIWGVGTTAVPATAENQLKIRLEYGAFDPLVDGEPAVPLALRAPANTPYALLQLAGPVQQGWLDDLQALGVTFYNFLPDYTYVVHIPAANRPAVATHPAVRWLGPLHPAYKLSPGLSGGLLLVELYPDASMTAVATLLQLAGATIREQNDAAHLFVVDAPETAVSALATIEQVRWIQNLAPMQEMNDDAGWLTQSGLYDVRSLHERGLTGAGQVAGVADSGLAVYDYGDAEPLLYDGVPSCYFVDNSGGTPQLPGPDHRKVVGYVVPPGSGGDRLDSTGHGTHVAGSIVGSRAPWDERAAADGQAYEARVFFQDIGRGVGFPESPAGEMVPPTDYRVLFGQAYDANGDGIYQPALEPRTHSNSWGSPQPIYSAETAQTDEFMWTHPDFLILFAAGNQGPGPNTVGYPATAKNIVSVGATENGLADYSNMGFYSSHGPAPMGRLAPTISAPGDRINSALRGDPCGSTPDRQGTSMAAPVAHGLALLMRQYLWDGYYPSGQANPDDHHHPSAALLKAMLISSGRPLDGLYTDNGAGGSWPSSGQGWGLVTGGDVLYFQGDRRGLWLHDEYALDGSVGFDAAGQQRSFTITVSNGRPWQPEPLKIVLNWTDYPGAAIAGGALVNDLNLTVTGPDGTVYLGNDPANNDFRGLPELPLTMPDSVNPWEVVYLENPLPGDYTVTVTAANLGSLALNGRKQGYALVITGDLLSRQGRPAIEHPRYQVSSSAVARLRLTDLDLNQDSQQAETVPVTVSSQTQPDGVTVTLVETDLDSAVFAGEIVLTTGLPAAGELAVAAGDTMTMAYLDLDDGRSGQAIVTATAEVMVRPLNFINPPTLSGADESEDGHITVTWSAPENVTNLEGYELQQTVAFTLPLFDDAEGDINELWQPGSLTAPWTQSPAYAQSGLLGYWSGRGDTGLEINTSLTLQQDVTLPLTVTTAQLSFYSRYFNGWNDSGHVEISTDGGQSWTRLHQLTAAPRLVPPDTRLQYHQLDLTPTIGTPFRIRFRYDNGVISQPPDSPGWWLDDIQISGGVWQTVATTAPGVTSAVVAVNDSGVYHYRVRANYLDGSATGWSHAAGVTVDRPTLPTPVGSGKASGGGWLTTHEGDKINFGFQVQQVDGPAEGELQLRDRLAGVKIHLDTVTAVGHVSGDCGGMVAGANALEFHGSGLFNDAPASFRVCLEDNGEPGHGDRFHLACLDGCLYETGGRVADNQLGGGNTRLHATPDGPVPPPDGEAEPSVLILQPLLLSEGTAGLIQPLAVAAYDADGAPMAGVTISLVSSDGSDPITAVTGNDGLVLLSVVLPLGEVEYFAAAGSLQANTVMITGLPAFP